MKVEKPLLRGHFHQAMFFVSLGASILLVAKSDSRLEYISTVIYSIALLSMFGISALYHRITWNPTERFLMKRLDHAGIYLMIAGCFTPICLLGLPGNTGMKLLSLIWIVGFIGIIQSIFFVNISKMFSAILYLVMGYMIVPYFSELSAHIGYAKLSLLIGGGIAYSIGAISYGLKRPVFKPLVFGYHEFFHIMVSVGAILHFILIYSIMS
jgi:hemolysin III